MFRISFKFRITDLSLTGGVLFAIASPTKAIAPPRYEAPSMCRLISLSSTTVDCFLFAGSLFPIPPFFLAPTRTCTILRRLISPSLSHQRHSRSSRVSNYHALAPHATLYRRDHAISLREEVPTEE